MLFFAFLGIKRPKPLQFMLDFNIFDLSIMRKVAFNSTAATIFERITHSHKTAPTVPSTPQFSSTANLYYSYNHRLDFFFTYSN